MDLLREIASSVECGDEARAAGGTREALASGAAPSLVLEEGLVRGMEVVGARFKAHEIFLPDVLLAAKAMIGGMEILKPLLEGEGVPPRGKIVIGTVKGDLHDIGKNLVGILLKGAGFEVIDLGRDVSPERFVDAAERERAAVIGMSALLTTTMPAMEKVVALVRERGLSGSVRTIVGGAPVSADFAREIGADSYGYDAANAVERVAGLMAR